MTATIQAFLAIKITSVSFPIHNNKINPKSYIFVVKIDFISINLNILPAYLKILNLLK